jgi:diguanylate cyclase (GGDEF)-like protein
LTASDNSIPPWISGEFDISSLLRGAPRLLTKDQFIDHLERQSEITRKSIDWRFAVFMVNIDALASIEMTRGKPAGDQILREAAERVGRRLNPRDAVALMRDQCFAVLVEVPLLHMAIEQIAAKIQADIAALVLEQNEPFDPTASIGIAKLSRNYFKATDVLRDAGLALGRAREAGPGTIMVFNRSMEPLEPIAT